MPHPFAVHLPDGSVCHPGGSVTLPDGSLRHMDGTLERPDGTLLLPNGIEVAASSKLGKSVLKLQAKQEKDKLKLLTKLAEQEGVSLPAAGEAASL